MGQVQGEAARLAGDASGQGEEASPEGLGGCYRFAQADARCPECQVVGHHLDGQPGAVGGEASRGEMVEPYAVPEVADGVLDLGVAVMVGLKIQGLALAVGDRVDSGRGQDRTLIGRQGEIRDRSSEGQHYRMAGLNLLAAIVIYWNTAHLGEAVRQRKHAGLTVEPELLAHILLTGEYRWPKRR